MFRKDVTNKEKRKKMIPLVAMSTLIIHILVSKGYFNERNQRAFEESGRF